MKTYGVLLLFAITTGTLFSRIEPSLEKTPAYFYDLYGRPASDGLDSHFAFWSPSSSKFIKLKGPFVVRTYATDRMRIRVVFDHPSLKAIYVTYNLSTGWDSEKALAALSAYGGNWESRKAINPYFISDRNDAAQFMLNSLYVASSGLLSALEKADAAAQAEKRKVPQF